MKKLITILTIMIVLASAVFAADPPASEPGYKPTDEPASTKSTGDGNAIINVTATIGSEWPKFQLATTAGAAVVTSAKGEAKLAALDADLVEDLTEADGNQVTVTFAINQISDSRTTDSYTLTVAASNLVLVHPLGGQAIEWATAVATNDDTRKFGVVAAAPKITKETVDNISMVDTVAGTLSVTYNGKKVKASTGVPKTLATFPVAWTTNTEAQAGDYKAEIKLTFTADI